MDMEVRSAVGDQKRQMTEKVGEFRKTLAALRKDLEDARTSEERAVLMGGSDEVGGRAPLGPHNLFSMHARALCRIYRLSFLHCLLLL